MRANPILITGAHRSGTTWVGKIISSSPGIQYVHEPFNIDYNNCGISPFYWFQYVTRGNEDPFYDYIKKRLTAEITPPAEKRVEPWSRWLASAAQPARVLMKDPIAVFSCEWLAARFGMDVAVIIRHPAAFVDCIQRRNWTHDFSHFLKQPLLMEEHLSPFKEEIVRLAEKRHDIFDQAILLWKLIYHVVGKFRLRHADWLFIKHEDLSLDPESGFREIFRHLNIKFNKAARKIIGEHSSSSNPIDGDIHLIKRNSKAIVKKWKNEFTSQQIKKIRESVEPISRNFYANEDWE